MRKGRFQRLLSLAAVARGTARLQNASVGKRLSAVAGAGVLVALGVLGYVARPLSVGAQSSQELSPQGVSSVALPDGRLVMTGGRTSAGPLAETWIVGTDGVATRVASMTAARSDHASTVLGDGRVLVAGGNGATGALDSAEF